MFEQGMNCVYHFKYVKSCIS